MSKFNELLLRIDKREYITEREHREFLGILQEAIAKAEKYDEIKAQNKVLVDGVKALNDTFNIRLGKDFLIFGSTPYRMTYCDAENDINKIKAMLEVVENEE